MKEKIARNLYRISAAGRYGADFSKWEILQPDQQDFFRKKADTLVLSLLKEEIEKSLLTDKERMAVYIPCEACSFTRDVLSTRCLDCFVKQHIQAQLDKVLKIVES